jgi:hypothetical protein
MHAPDMGHEVTVEEVDRVWHQVGQALQGACSPEQREALWTRFGELGSCYWRLTIGMDGKDDGSAETLLDGTRELLTQLSS